MSSNSRIVLVSEDDDKKASLSTRGLKDVLSVEIVNASGEQITSFGGDNVSISNLDEITNVLPASLTDIGNLKVSIEENGITLPVSLASVPSHAVTNAGTFAVQIVDTSFAVADGNALGEGVLIQGDDGTDRKNVAVDGTTGNLEIDINSATIQAPVERQSIYRPLHAATTTPLGIDASYTSTGEDALSYDRITGTVFADQAGTLYIEQSTDDTNWDDSESTAISASAGISFDFALVSRYVRIRYVNGGTGQSAFRLTGYLKT